MSQLHLFIKENNHEKIIKNINCENYILDEKRQTPFGLMIKDYPQMVPTYDDMFLTNINYINSLDVELYSDYLIKLYAINPSSFYTKIIKILTKKHENMFAAVDAKFFDITKRHLKMF